MGRPDLPLLSRRSAGAADVLAGVTVALILVPQSLAYGRLAGVPPDAALRAAVIAPLVAAVLASSPYLQTGPVAITALLTFGAIEGHAAAGTAEWTALAAMLAVAVGAFRVLLGVTRAGDHLAHLLSEPVMAGFTIAAAATIACSQVPAALGVTAGSSNPLAAAADALSQPSWWSFESLALASVGFALPLAARRVSAVFPSVAVAVVVGALWAASTGSEVAQVGTIGVGVTSPFSGLGTGDAVSLVPAAMVIGSSGSSRRRRSAAGSRSRTARAGMPTVSSCPRARRTSPPVSPPGCRWAARSRAASSIAWRAPARG